MIKEACCFRKLKVSVKFEDCEILFLSLFVGPEEYLSSRASHDVFQYMVYRFPNSYKETYLWLVRYVSESKQGRQLMEAMDDCGDGTCSLVDINPTLGHF